MKIISIFLYINVLLQHSCRLFRYSAVFLPSCSVLACSNVSRIYTLGTYFARVFFANGERLVRPKKAFSSTLLQHDRALMNPWFHVFPSTSRCTSSSSSSTCFSHCTILYYRYRQKIILQQMTTNDKKSQQMTTNYITIYYKQ